MRRRRVVVADDSLLFLNAVLTTLKRAKDIDVVRVAHSGSEALELVDDLKPDLILMDLTMPVMNGLEATRRLVERSNRPQIIIMSTGEPDLYHAAALSGGAGRLSPKVRIVGEAYPTHTGPSARSWRAEQVRLELAPGCRARIGLRRTLKSAIQDTRARKGKDRHCTKDKGLRPPDG